MKKYFSITLLITSLVLVTWLGSVTVKAETVAPTSRLQIISDILTESGYRTVAPGPWGDWGPMWNRIYWAATWSPNATAGTADVLAEKTFYTGGNRTIQTGQMTTQSAPATVTVTADPSKISLIYQAVASRSYGLETSGLWGDWGSVWNRLYSAATWMPSDASAIPEDVAQGKTFYAGTNRELQKGTYVFHIPNPDDTTAPVVSAGASQHSYVNLVRTFTGTANDADTGIATTTWSKQDGSGTVTFGNPTELITTVKASAPGTYTLLLTATDHAGNSGNGVTQYIVHKLADYNNDGKVDLLDLIYLGQNWNGTEFMADFNGNGTVDLLDLIILGQNWTN